MKIEQLEFLAIGKSKRENWLATMTPEEKAIMGKHLEYVRQMNTKRESGFVWPCLDGAYGIIIYKADLRKTHKKCLKTTLLFKQVSWMWNYIPLKSE